LTHNKTLESFVTYLELVSRPDRSPVNFMLERPGIFAKWIKARTN